MSQGKTRETSWRDTARTVAIAGLLFVGVRTAVAEPFHVPSESMEPTLLVGDFMFASKFAYGYSNSSLPFHLDLFRGRILARAAQRGDVVVFSATADRSQDWVTRVVGVPGDTIQVRGGVLPINGAAVGLERIADFVEADVAGRARRIPQYIETLPGGARHLILHGPGLDTLDDTEPFVVPAGHYFVMGDNRSNSLDSRVSPAHGGVGFLPAENLIGRADVRHFSLDTRVNWWHPANWFRALRLDRIGLIA